MKKIIALLLVVLMAIGLVACAKPAAPAAPVKEEPKAAAPAAAPAAEPAAAPVSALDAGTVASITADLGLVVRDDSEYVSMSMDELYEVAKTETGSPLVVYSETSSATKVLDSFNAAYPGLTIEATKVKSTEITEKVPLEADSGNPYYDLIITSDPSGSIYKEWYNKGYIVAYFPDTLAADMKEEFTGFGLPITLEADVWWYNTKQFPDASPVTNLWDLVELDENGNSKFTLVTHPISNMNTCGQFCNYIANADAMAAAYKEKYGKDIEYTYDADELGVAEPNNAGYEWVYRYIQCDRVLINSADECLAAVNAVTEADKPIVCMTSSLKLGDCIAAGMDVNWIGLASPFNGFVRAKHIYINPKSDNPATARLYAMYILGGEDGQGDGYTFFVDRKGCYGTRKSFDDLKYNDVTIEKLNVFANDLDFVYDNYLFVQDFVNYYADVLKK